MPVYNDTTDMDIDTGLVRQLIESQFPQWSDFPMRPVKRSGWDNRMFRLGDDFVVRMPSAERYVWQVQKEQTWLPLLSTNLSVPIPCVVAEGRPEFGYLWPWSVYRWIEGEDLNETTNQTLDRNELAVSVGHFLKDLHRQDASGGPIPGQKNFFRGGSLQHYDVDTRLYIESLMNIIPSEIALSIWKKALTTSWHADSVWVHGDLEPGNILMHENKLAAVIDFGGCAVGDPACDLVMAWTYFDALSREHFRETLNLDNDTWDRGIAWALWKALFRMMNAKDQRSDEYFSAKRIVDLVCSVSA